MGMGSSPSRLRKAKVKRLDDLPSKKKRTQMKTFQLQTSMEATANRRPRGLMFHEKRSNPEKKVDLPQQCIDSSFFLSQGKDESDLSLLTF